MKDPFILFDDPEGKFSITLPWHVRKGKKDNTLSQPYQFPIGKAAYFQISCREINDQIKTLIHDEKLKFFDPTMAEATYSETFEADFLDSGLRAYIWKCPVGNHFLLALYVYDPEESGKLGDQFHLQIMRMALGFIKLDPKALGIEMPLSNSTSEKDYYNIKTWKNSNRMYMTFMSSVDRSKWKLTRIAPLKIDVVDLYTLLTNKVSLYPNGYYSQVHVGKPMDNMIWWDFILESDKGFIHVWRTPHILECDVHFVDDSFDVQKLFKDNIELYKSEIKNSLKKYEKHSVYINHYMSYSECVESTWKEIQSLDLTPPDLFDNHVARGPIDDFASKLQTFAKTSAKYHTLAKSLVLHAAFKIESFLNLAIRIGATNELKMYPEVLRNFLKADFSQKMKHFGFYSRLLLDEIDLRNTAVQDALSLMTLRNKYVHSDETSEHNKLGEVYFHGDIPLHRVTESRPGVEAFKQIFHVPSLEVVKKSYETSHNFVTYMKSLIPDDIRDNIIRLMEANPISYNEDKKGYSSVYQDLIVDFFGLEKDDKAGK